MEVEFKRFDSLEAVPLDATSWNQLVGRADVGSVFQCHSWIHSWWQHFGSAYELCFVCALEKNQVIAFAPMMIDNSRTLRFIGDSNSDYLGFVIPEDRQDLTAEFLGALRDLSGNWNTAHLRNIPHDSNLSHSIMGTSYAEKLYPWLNYTETAPFLRISGNEDGVGALLNKYSIRRSIRQIEAQGTVQFVELRNATDAEPFWRSFSEQHKNRSAEQGRESPFSDPAYLEFLRATFETDRENDHVHFSAVLLNDQPIAFHYGFVSQNRILWYKPSLDTNIRKGSPGVVLICALIQSAVDNGYGELDFTIGDEPFKDRFCSDKRTVHSYRIYRSRIAYVTEKYYWLLRNLVKRIVK